MTINRPAVVTTTQGRPVSLTGTTAAGRPYGEQMTGWNDTDNFADGPGWKFLGGDDRYHYWLSPGGTLHRSRAGYWEVLKKR